MLPCLPDITRSIQQAHALRDGCMGIERQKNASRAIINQRSNNRVWMSAWNHIDVLGQRRTKYLVDSGAQVWILAYLCFFSCFSTIFFFFFNISIHTCRGCFRRLDPERVSLSPLWHINSRHKNSSLACSLASISHRKNGVSHFEMTSLTIYH